MAPIIRSIRQFTGDYLYRELQFRQKAGQHRLVAQVLERFPADGASDRTLVAVREMLRLSQQQRRAVAEIPEQLKECIDKVPEEGVRSRYMELYEEVKRDLSVDLLDRFAAFRTLGKDTSMPAEERLALAASGWLVGKDNASRQRTLAISLLRIREHVLRYLREENDLLRSTLVSDWQSEEGATIPLVTAILTHMKPPLSDDLPEPVAVGEYHVNVKTGGTAGRPEVTLRYRIQLPSEYNPYRRYPTIIALHGERSDAGKELDWWAGTRRDGDPMTERQGQASRRGYIVLTPEWMTADQRSYGFSAREHATVLTSLRDACRKFAIDTDRVFLTGHSVGADAAWDIGPAHPDLWAGVIPITGTTRMYGDFIYPNTIYVPMYIVCGEMDPGRTIVDNAKVLDRMMARRLCNVTVAEFIGRGHDDFSDEIHHLFEWMDAHRRNFFPEEFEVRMMRPWDNFYWWVELLGTPSKLLVEPTEWNMRRPTRPVEIRAKISSKKDSLYVQSPADEVIVWISPELLNIEENVSIRLNGRVIPLRRLTPSIEVMLEDARRRCDLQHPFPI
ncbi:MAG: peptidase, partial [Planctomycetia bacterium]|nr:peptidase [Planctomycetia bacterium]